MTRVEQLAQEWFPQALLASGLTRDEFNDAAHTLLGGGTTSRAASPSVGQALRELEGVVDSFFRAFPLCLFSEIAGLAGDPRLAHTIRTRAEKLAAIYYRMKEPRNGTFGVLARAWQDGALDLDIAAELLHLSRADFVVALEHHGYARPLDRILMDDAKANAVLERLRNARLGRAGRTIVDEALVTRDVVASQRIEGVDAQRWLPGRTS